MSESPSRSTASFLSKKNLLCRDRIGALIFLVVCLCYGYQTTQIPLFPGDEYEPFTARTLPTILTFIGIALALLLLISADNNDEAFEVRHFNWKLLAGFIVLMALYGIGLTYVGFVLATIAFLLAGFFILGERRKKVLFGASIPFVIAFYLLLTQGLDVYLEPGLLFLMWS
ncbi:tripartite tricarboxylate transporter TctB family protein [Vibrio sp. 404]|uniref:Tripartite tricarboxylate transporter TctB family protein n=1 Tax=Vibrio marinisediminis TaxID=2758441 RepID=A0A7W2FRN3_9VIBR|nr:tripartite tricarboxylate transporter TctB family protein [Vibrio marinisediminis]MBA5762947.1 tripartite tricarboxylate transporter TctB family protein [Vibrio marinisediminis]